MKVFDNMPYAVNLDNIGYFPVSPEFQYAIVQYSGDFISDCILVNILGERCPGFEYPIPINNNNLSELSYASIVNILHLQRRF
ncbi:MAG: hypothetical protein ACKN9E_10020 [Microcystaceae cyanobacterium]